MQSYEREKEKGVFFQYRKFGCNKWLSLEKILNKKEYLIIYENEKLRTLRKSNIKSM